MKIQIRCPFTLLVRVLTVALCAVPQFMKSAVAAEWRPGEPVKFVTHVNPGGGGDIFTRFVVETIRSDNLWPGVSMEVLNRSGASGAVAINYLAQKKGEAANLLNVTSYVLATPLRNKELPTYREFQPVAVMATDTNAIYVQASGPYRTLQDLIEAARRKPKSVTKAFGVWGGTNHIIGHQLAKATGVEFAYVIFKGGGESTTALLGGHVDFTSDNPSEVRGHVESGKLRVVAVVGDRRLPVFKDVPTLKELGYNIGPILPTFRGFIAPAGTPKEAIDTYAALFRRVIGTAAWKRYVADNQLEEEFRGPTEMKAYLDGINETFIRLNAEIGQLKK